jgi:hypothetical protein
MNTGGARTIAEDVLDGAEHLRIENTALSADEVADRVVRTLRL